MVLYVQLEVRSIITSTSIYCIKLYHLSITNHYYHHHTSYTVKKEEIRIDHILCLTRNFFPYRRKRMYVIATPTALSENHVPAYVACVSVPT